MDNIVKEMESSSIDLINQLRRATENGNASWFHRDPEHGEVYCFVAGEIIYFHLESEDSAEGCSISGLYGVGANIRNTSFVWLRSSEGWDKLLELIEIGLKNQINDKEFHSMTASNVRTFLNGLTAL